MVEPEFLKSLRSGRSVPTGRGPAPPMAGSAGGGRGAAWARGRRSQHVRLCCRLANSDKQGVRTHAVSVSGKRLRADAAEPAVRGTRPRQAGGSSAVWRPRLLGQLVKVQRSNCLLRVMRPHETGFRVAR